VNPFERFTRDSLLVSFSKHLYIQRGVEIQREWHIHCCQIEQVDFSEGHVDAESSKNIKAFGGMWCCIVLGAGYG
jgi:hypothetical protein